MKIAHLTAFEGLLIALDDGVWHGVSRVIEGFFILPLIGVFAGDRDTIWLPFAVFFGLLFALRIIPALLRAVIPFSPDAKAIWVANRRISKRHDSYQWQKLFWLGLGMLLYAIVRGGIRAGDMAIVIFSLTTGAAGLFFWSRVRLAGPVSD